MYTNQQPKETTPYNKNSHKHIKLYLNFEEKKKRKEEEIDNRFTISTYGKVRSVNL